MSKKDYLQRVKDTLLGLKEDLLSIGRIGSRDYEFNGSFVDHPISDSDIYRLYYVNYHRIREYEGCTANNIGVVDFPYKPFKLPEGMSREDGFKVISYLTDSVERNSGLEPFSLGSVKTTDKVLDLERLGFRRVDEKDEDKIINLFTVTGRLLLFTKSKLYPKYFEWYTEGITKEEVSQIYAKCGIEFKDIVWEKDDNQKIKPKVYTKSNNQ